MQPPPTSMSPSASAGMSPTASTSRRLSKPRSMLASPYSTLPKEWVGSVFAHTLGTTAVGASPILGGLLLLQQTTIINHGARDKITSLANGHTVSLREGFRSIT
ncbi:uncharacterized protein LOC121970177 [Zingiber officinale]|uniref:uncharacterized protein LOC121970177 n=1 Tax=Zingiber officinale TaxID=94328 RepID=UPI001C4B560F|nr:uncharacterized protein LOC121970177 [Zingiber officinale]